MLQKIFLGIIAGVLLMSFFLSIPMFEYYNIEVTNTTLNDEIKEKRDELNELREEALIAESRIEILSQQLGVFSFDDENANENLEERIYMALDARTYIYENFEEGVNSNLEAASITGFSISRNFSDYEQRLNSSLKSRYLNVINSTVRLLASDYFESIGFFEGLSPSEYSIRYDIYKGFVQKMSMISFEPSDFDNYIDLDLTRRIYEEGETVENLEELRQSVVYNYINYLEDENLVGWFQRIE